MSLETRNLNKFRVSVSSEELSKWVLRLVMPLAILAWIILGLVILWAAGHIFRSLLVLAVAALLSFALTPAVKLLERVMPRIVAILIVYLVVLSGISLLLYFVVNTAASQGTAGDHKGSPSRSPPPSPLRADEWWLLCWNSFPFWERLFLV
jgi:hypothetical protein